MKRLGLLLALALATPALGQAVVVKTLTGQALSMSAPTLATDGVDLTNAQGFAVVVSAESTRTITGGSLLCYWYVPVTGQTSSTGVTYRWTRCAAGLDFTPRTGARDAPSLDYEPLVGVSRVAFVTSSVTVSAGTTVDVTIIVRKRL
jgi:hypothetical protein